MQNDQTDGDVDQKTRLRRRIESCKSEIVELEQALKALEAMPELAKWIAKIPLE